MERGLEPHVRIESERAAGTGNPAILGIGIWMIILIISYRPNRGETRTPLKQAHISYHFSRRIAPPRGCFPACRLCALSVFTYLSASKQGVVSAKHLHINENKFNEQSKRNRRHLISPS